MEFCSVKMIIISMVIFNLVSFGLIGLGVYLATQNPDSDIPGLAVTWIESESCNG